MSALGRAVPAASACWLMAKLYLVQLFRSRAIWVAFAVAAIPGVVAMIAAQHEPTEAWEITLGIVSSLMLIVPPAFSASIIADELDKKTYTFLWSRPIPRWSIFVGKLAGAIPLAIATMMVALAVGWGALEGDGLVTQEQLWRAVGAFSLGTFATCAVAAGIGTLVPKHPIVASIVYLLLLDAPVSAVPADARYASLSFVTAELSGLGGAGASTAAATTAALGVAAAWMTIGLWRLSRAEGALKPS